ncbi:unnamed protein product [Gadus morhua 'NCC']
MGDSVALIILRSKEDRRAVAVFRASPNGKPGEGPAVGRSLSDSCFPALRSLTAGSQPAYQPARNLIACLKSFDARSPITERPSRGSRSVPHPGIKTHQPGNSSPGGLGPTRDQDRGHVAQVTGKYAGESDPRRKQCEPTWVLVLPLNPNSV